MFQAVESYDRRTFKAPAASQEKHEARLQSILSAVLPCYKKWLQGKLRYSHEPTAATRITRIVEGLEAGWLLSPGDIDLAADFRNYFTHFDPELESRLPPSDARFRRLYNLAMRLQMLCELILLTAIGFSPNELKQRAEQRRRLEGLLVDEGN